MAKKNGASAEFQRLKKASRKTGFKVTKKMIVGVIIALAVLVLLVAAFFGIKYLTSSVDGSLRRNPFTDQLITGENWLLVCPNSQSVDKLFYKVGETRPITGFALTQVRYGTNKEKPIYEYAPIDPAAEEIDGYFVGTAEQPYETMPQKALDDITSYLTPVSISELITDTIDGTEISYFYYLIPNMAQDGTIESYTAALNVYLNCGREDSCVFFQITHRADQAEDTATQRQLFNYADNIVKKITLEPAA